VLKSPISASKLIKSNTYREAIKKGFSEQKKVRDPIAIIGHCRLVTNGHQCSSYNNQPVIKDGVVGIHNGIIVNDESIWNNFAQMTRKYEIDTEVILSSIQLFRKETGSLISAVQKTFSVIEGAASIGLLFSDTNKLLLATNTGSLYTCFNISKTLFVFASEKYILEQFVSEDLEKLDKSLISQVKPFYGSVIDIDSLDSIHFSLNVNDFSEDFLLKDAESLQDDLRIIDLSDSQTICVKANNVRSLNKESIQRKIVGQPRPDKTLKRCTKCILPETFPSIEFDEHGVCNYCRSHKKLVPKGQEELKKMVEPYKSENGEPDCILGFSGGRDSSYMLHYIKKVLYMNPIAYTYDWGMVTDLARRNQARICGKLGVEHILVSADINNKRENIRKNIEAWLKKPNLGMVPLLMAGDKQFYYHAHQIMSQTGVKLLFNGGNSFEKTDFKLGFCGIHEGDTNGKILTGISFLNKLKLPMYYGMQYLLNPAYINSSNVLPDAHIYFYHYLKWDEKEVVSTLRSEYDWEVANDTSTTWRIGDGTAAFYDYIYYTVAGFSEFDTFRSNQIREGLLTRKEALKLVNQENIPRYESLAWYANTIGFDLENALDVIHSIPKIYRSSYLGSYRGKKELPAPSTIFTRFK
jgi:asparagine synthetase B (glutamine-hydrolysing)